MEKKSVRSGRRMVLRSMWFLLAFSIACTFGISAYSVWTYEKQLVYCNQAAINLYENNLTRTLDEVVAFDRTVYGDNQDFRLLSIEKEYITDAQRLASMKSLRQLLHSQVPVYGASYVFNESGTVDYYSFGQNFSGSYITRDEMDLMKSIRRYWLSADPSLISTWQLLVIDGHPYLTNAYCYRNIYICSTIQLQAFEDFYQEPDGSVQYVFYSEDRILTNSEYMEKAGITLEKLRKGEEWDIRPGVQKYIVQSVFYPTYGIGFAGLIATKGVWSYLGTFLLIMVVVFAALILVFFLIYSMFRRFMVYPLEQITRMSRHLKEPEYQLPARMGESDLQEFQEIRSGLVRLMEQKNELERENLEKSMETDHALLQYYQLQTRSHFFLNCLKSIYSMTENGEDEKTKRMITLFSNHLRYIFHDNLELVTLKDELEEVQDYYQIIQLDRANPILLSVNVDESLLGEMVPPLCIQTFLENSHKHNRQNSRILKFTVRADRVEMEKGLFLRLRLTDNGSGYPEETLKKLYEPSPEFEQYHVGINNLKRRIRLIYHDDYEMAFYNLPGGGACNVICLPVSAERKKEQQNG